MPNIMESHEILIDDQKFKYALKNMLPIPSNSEQQILLDEYSSQLTQFSIEINSLIKEDICDENCVYLVQLLGGMYTLLKTTLLSPPNYNDLFQRISRIESDAHRYLLQWATISDKEKQEELFEISFWCESALPRTYLVTILYSSLPMLWQDPKNISSTLSVCKALQHPLKGSFLLTRFHSFLLKIYFSEHIRNDEEIKALIIGYSIETFTTLLRLFIRWHQSLPSKSTDPAYISSLYFESFSNIFNEISRMCTFDMFEAFILPTFLVEIVNSGDSLAQTLLFQSIINEFDPQYLLAQLSQIIKASSQLARGIDLKALLDQLFNKVKKGINFVFFDTIWEETSNLIKNRCEIDQSDTVIISFLVLSLISQEETGNEMKISSIEKVLEFLIKTIKSIRSDGFDTESSSVGKEILQLISGMTEEFDFDEIILNLKLLSELLACLNCKSARNCCLNVISPKLTSKTLSNTENYGKVLGLFGCLSRTCLIDLLDGEDQLEEHLSSITRDLKEFSLIMISLLPKENYKQFYESFESPSSCLNLFLIPELINLAGDSEVSLCKRMINTGYLRNTSTVLPQRFIMDGFEWIEPEYTKLMAVKLNLQVMRSASDDSLYEFYTEIITILNNNVSQDYLKIQIIEQILSSFTETRSKLSTDDFQCLIDHLFRESSQLLKKIDRCKMFLSIIKHSDEKYLDQIINTLNQLSQDDEEEKFKLACELLELILLDSSNPRNLKRNEEIIYDWALGETKKDPSKEIKFYSIKLKYNSIIINQTEPPIENVPDNFIEDELVEITELTSEDLQKLKIFESFDLE